MRGSGRRGALRLALASLACAALAFPSAEAASPDPLTLLQRYLRIDTSNPPGNEAEAAAFFKDLLGANGIEAILYPIGPAEQRRANVMARLKATGSGARGRSALLLFNHMDVVQADPARWSVDPFSGELRDGYVYGRGALDMKTTGLLQALVLIRLKQEGVLLERDVIFLGTAGEEAGSEGMRWMIQNHPNLFQEIQIALTEGDNIRVAPGGKGPVVQAWGVDVSEKVTAWMKLTAHGRAGHGSVATGEDNAVVRLVRALERISRHETAVRILPEVAAYYAALAERFPDLPAGKLRALERSLRGDQTFRAAFLADPGRAATVRSTISITVLQGGPQTNVIPSTAVAHLDCRLLPGESPEAFAKEIQNVAGDPNITVEPLIEAREASSSSTETDLFRAIQSAARRFAPGVPVVPTLLTSWTESSLLRPLGIHSYGFEPYALDDQEVSLSHSDDERISVDNVRTGFEILYAIVREAAVTPVSFASPVSSSSPISSASSGPSRKRLTGFTRAGALAERQAEARLAASLDPNRVDRDFRELTREPHPAGSERNNDLAHFVAASFREAGLEDVTEAPYDVLMSYPREVSVEMVSPRRHRAMMSEDVYAVDPDTANPRLGLPYHAFSASGEVTADVVYARNGNPADFEHLRSLGIDLRGRLALVRYSVPYSYRGFKAYTAEKLGLAGLLIYSDPKDDGFVKGKVFPDGPWGPIGHIQRGAITYDFLVPGDPLTPGWASVEGARRIPESEALPLPRIMSAPISARDAREILAALEGPEAPEPWRGALDVTYRVGPGPARVRLKLDVPRPVTKIINVTAQVTGGERPDQIVLLGNHRDAWIYGGVDPASGTATMLELARGLGRLLKAGWRPRRTIMLASWDAEEFALTGSTEWGEQHLEELRRNLVLYLNVDSSTSGSTFSVSASGCLAPFIEEAIGDVQDPETGLPILKVWRRGREGGGATALASGAGRVSPIGSGSDHTVFLNLVGAPSLDMTFDGDYGVYHSAYDDYYWMTRFGDPGLRYMTRMAEVWGRMAMRAASADILPIDYAVYGRQIGGFLDELKDPSLTGEASRAAKELAAAGRRLRRIQIDPSRIEAMGPQERERLNLALMSAERALCDEKGLPDRPWFKHLIYACRYTYAALVLPGLTEAVEGKDLPQARQREKVLALALRKAAGSLK